MAWFCLGDSGFGINSPSRGGNFKYTPSFFKKIQGYLGIIHICKHLPFKTWSFVILKNVYDPVTITSIKI